MKNQSKPKSIKEEVNMTLQFFVDSDIRFYGKVTDETLAVIKRQGQKYNTKTKQVIF